MKQIWTEAVALRSELLAWASAQIPLYGHKTVAYFTQPYVLRFPAAEDLLCPAARADIYPDCKLYWHFLEDGEHR